MDKSTKAILAEQIQNLIEYMGVELGDTVQFLEEYIYVEFSEPNDKYRIKYPGNWGDTWGYWETYVYILEKIIMRKYGDR